MSGFLHNTSIYYNSSNSYNNYGKKNHRNRAEVNSKGSVNNNNPEGTSKGNTRTGQDNGNSKGNSISTGQNYSSGNDILALYNKVATFMQNTSLGQKVRSDVIEISLKVLGFDVDNLDLSNVDTVNFEQYISLLLQKASNNTDNTSVIGDSSLTDSFDVNLQDIKKYIQELSTEEQQATLDSIPKYADFLLNETYKNYASSENILPDELQDTAKTCLKIAGYENLGEEVDLGDWERVSELTLDDEANSGLYASTYINNSTTPKQLIVNFKATNTSADIVTDDMSMMRGEVPDQYEKALTYTMDIINKPEYADYDIVITGFSLGASLAELVSSSQDINKLDRNVNAITYNAFGTKDIVEKYSEMFTNTTDDDVHIYNFITEDDMVSCSSEHVGTTMWASNDDQLVPHMGTALYKYFGLK